MSQMRTIIVFAIFMSVTLGGGILIGINTAPGPWYESLIKPFFNPPNWIFGPVWSVLYILIAIAGARSWLRHHRKGLVIWSIQLVLNFLWSPVFFGFHHPVAALLIIVMLLIAILAFIVFRWKDDRFTAILFIPYAGWVLFATYLNGAIVFLN